MSILKKLGDYDENGRVVSFNLSPGHTFIRVEECCDNYFYEDLSKDEFAQMIAELQALHDQMVDK